MYLEDDLLNYSKSDNYPFHMPGHKRQAGLFPLAAEAGLKLLNGIDITEIPGFDDLHDPQGVLKEEMRRAAAFYGTKDTIFSVNGSTASNLTAISASVPFGGRLLMAENCHRSVFHAVELRHIEADLIHLKEIAQDVPGPVDPSDVEEAFLRAERTSGKTAPGYDAIIITSPTYEGVVSDVAAIADVVHSHGAVLIVDEAHGAHLSLHPAFPQSAVRPGSEVREGPALGSKPDPNDSSPDPDDLGPGPDGCGRCADLVTQSLHKTLPSLTQTSILHNVTGRVPTEDLMRWMDIYETSSPSYILMASITSCLHLLMEKGPELFDGYVRELARCRDALRGMKHLKLLEPDNGLYDPSKIVVLTGDAGGSGTELAERLREEYHLILEKTMPHYALAMTSVADTPEGFRRLADALLEIDAGLG